MTRLLQSMLVAVLMLVTFQSAQADSYSETKEVFIKAGESGAYFKNA